MITINNDFCIQCLRCTKVCPLKVIDVEDEKVKLCRKENCILCGHCISVCPVGAVTAYTQGLSMGKSIEDVGMPSESQMEDFLLSRRSIRNYSSREVEREKIQKILDIATHAPTACNVQDVRFVVVGPEGSREIERLASNYYIKQPDNNTGKLIKNAGFKILFNAPVTIGMFSKKDANPWNSALTAQYLVLAAHGLGLGTCYNGILNRAYNNDDCLQKYFNLSDEWAMNMFISLGYPDVSTKHRYIIKRNKAKVIWKD